MSPRVEFILRRRSAQLWTLQRVCGTRMVTPHRFRLYDGNETTLLVYTLFVFNHNGDYVTYSFPRCQTSTWYWDNVSDELAVFSLRQNAGVYQANYQSHSRRQSNRPSPTLNNSSIYLKKQHENTFHKSTRSRFEPNISRTGLANYYCASLV
jgi:hypothetical protein